MLRKIPLYCTLVFTLSLFNLQAHWVEDNGPTVNNGNPDYLQSEDGGAFAGDTTLFTWKAWEIYDFVNDSQNNQSLYVTVYHYKKIDYDLIPLVSGKAYCKAKSRGTVSDAVAKGKYEVHAKARGSLWWRNDKLKSSFQGSLSKYAQEKAKRYAIAVNPTYSGVHVWGKAFVKNQAGEKTVELGWY